MNKKVVLGFSGGMDSAYAAILLKNQGYDVIGVNLVMHDNCDFSYAASHTASLLGIPLIVVDARQEFKDKVIKPFADEYVSGYTPNPCIVCNPAVKFKLLFDVADKQNAEIVATGHYVKTIYQEGRYTFAPAADSFKDQAYFLYRLPQEYLKRLIFPLEGITKSTIKDYFLNHNGILSSSKESYDICFIGNNSYEDVVSDYVQLPPCGDILDAHGKIIGQHRGIHAYTVGQRKGLGVALGKPAFVSDINAENNTITLSFVGENTVEEFSVEKACYLSRASLNVGECFYVKVRYKAKPIKCCVTDISCDKISVKFEVSQKPIAKGQSAVFYDEDGLIVFGGIIC